MLNLKIWILVFIIIIAIGVGYGLGYGYKNGNCILCKSFKKNDIVAKSEKENKLDQDDANILVSNIVKLGTVLDDGTFTLKEGNEEKYQKMFDALNKYSYSINYKSILAESKS